MCDNKLTPTFYMVLQLTLYLLDARRTDNYTPNRCRPIAVVDPVTGKLKRAKESFPGGISDNKSLQSVAIGLCEGVNQYLCRDISSNKKLRKVGHFRLFLETP